MDDKQKLLPVRVALRCRPLVTKELVEGCQVCVKFAPGQVILRNDKTFSYDFVFSPDVSQKEVYDTSVAKLIGEIFKGYNVTVLAYGQTGSGKTFTMGTSTSGGSSSDVGIIPRAVEDIFEEIHQRPNKEFIVKVSFLEIHKEDILDLLSKTQEPLAIRENPMGQIKIAQLSEVHVRSPKETLQRLELGSASRSTASTNMNSRSSRSHAIFTLTVEQRDKTSDDTVVSKFHLVDLAGSERAKKTKATGERFREGVNINKGLLSLGNVISALCDESAHIPYRDSKLTRLLQDSLGGNSQTVMIACVSPADSNFEETLNTLRYADRARKIKNKPIVNRDPQQAEIFQLRQQVQQLKVELLRAKTLQGGAGDESPTSDKEEASDSDESNVNMKVLLERNSHLEAENRNLLSELQSALDQLSTQTERMIIDQMENQKLKQLVEQLSLKMGNLNTTEDEGDQASLVKDIQDSIQDFMEGESKRRLANESLFKVQKGPSSERDTLCAILEETSVETEPNGEPNTDLNMEATFRRAAMSRELEELNRVLQAKEELASKMCITDAQLEVMRMQYEAANKQLEKEVALLKKERDDLSMVVISSQQNTPPNKSIAEKRRKRIQELEESVAKLKRTIQEQSKIIRYKEDSERNTAKLQQEIQSMKQTRVRLMRQLKEESERHRQAKCKSDREVRVLKLREQQRTAQMARLERESNLKLSVLRRRMEEAQAAKQRLAASLERRHERRPAGAAHQQGMGTRIKNWLQDELLIISDSKKLEHHISSLIEGRKATAVEVHKLKQALNAQPREEERASLQARLEELECDLQARNEQISELQQKILDVDPEKRVKNMFNSTGDILESRMIATHLFKMLIDKEIESYLLSMKVEDIGREADQNKAILEQTQKTVELQQKDFDRRIMDLEKQHQEKTLYLLKHSTNATLNTNSSVDSSLLERFEFQNNEISRLQYVHEELQRKTEEVDRLQKELDFSRSSQRREYLPDLSAKKKKPSSTKTGVKQEIPWDLLDDIDESFDWQDKDNDPDWCASPLLVNRKRKSDDEDQRSVIKRTSSAVACKCRNGCRSGRCGCNKKQKTCSELCSCKGDCTLALEPEPVIEEQQGVEQLTRQMRSLREQQLK